MDTSNFDKVLAAVKAGAEIAAALVPFLTAGPEYVRKIVEAWRALGLTDDEIRAHIAGSEQEVRDLVEQWLANLPETPRHPDSKL